MVDIKMRGSNADFLAKARAFYGAVRLSAAIGRWPALFVSMDLEMMHSRPSARSNQILGGATAVAQFAAGIAMFV